MDENLKNVTDKPDNWEMVENDEIFIKFRHFPAFPLGLDRGFDTFCPAVHSMVQWWCQWCQNVQNHEKPLGLDRGFSKIVKNHWKSLFLVVFDENVINL